MFNQHFGQYLVGRQLITQEQLFEVLAQEKHLRLKIGVLAVNAGLMTAEQVEEVCQEQRCADKWFGQIAIEKGYLTPVQFEDLLNAQKDGFLSISQAIVDKGYVTLAELETVLEEYKKFSNLSPEQWKALQAVDFTSIVRMFLDFSGAGKSADMYYNYTALMLRNIVRVLSEEGVVANAVTLPKHIPGWLISQRVTGDMKLFTGLNLDDQGLMAAANLCGKGNFTIPDNLAADCLGEFLNVVNGVFCAAAFERGIHFSRQPQAVCRDFAVPQLQGYIIPISLSFGRMNLVLAVE